MRKNQRILSSMWGLVVLGCFASSAGNAAIVNLSFTEDIDGFTSTWVISDNGGGDYSGTESVIGTFWQISFTADESTVLQDTVGHVLGTHGEAFEASSYDYGMLPTSSYSESSYNIHGNGHRDDFSFSSEFIDGDYVISLAGSHSIPIPAAVWLFGSGLGLLGWLRRR